MLKISQPELVNRVNAICQEAGENQNLVVRLRGKKVVLGKYKGSFRDHCTYWLKSAFRKSPHSTYSDYLADITTRESEALAKALSRELSKRTVTPCDLPGEITTATLKETLASTSQQLKDFDATAAEFLAPIVEGSPLTEDVLDNPKATLKAALMDRKIQRLEQLHELELLVSDTLPKASRELKERVARAINDAAITMELQKEAVDYASREKLLAGLKPYTKPGREDLSDDWVWVDDTPDDSGKNDGVILRAAKTTINFENKYDSAYQFKGHIISRSLDMLKKKYPSLATDDMAAHVRDIQEYLQKHMADRTVAAETTTAPLTPRVPASEDEGKQPPGPLATASLLGDVETALPERPLSIQGDSFSDAASVTSSSYETDESRDHLTEEQNLSGITIPPIKEEIPDKRQPLGRSDSGVDIESRGDKPV